MNAVEIIVTDRVAALEALASACACIDVLTLATRALDIDRGRAKEGIQNALDDIGWRIAAVMAYIDTNLKTA